MTKTIRILSDLTINQIAAGEVIEHPASVIKELVENAIDAGSSQIEVETLAGGFQWIKISDNGSGMSPEDAALSLERHATSKLAQVDDLLTLHTMGFRGEALASIASISKMTLLTSQDGERATKISVEGGKISSIAPAARAKGTTIEVHSLFYNVPARKKFQKSPSASSAEITKIMTQLSLAHPFIGFTLVQQNRTLFSVPPGQKDLLDQLKERGSSLLSTEFIPSCKEFRLDDPHCQGRGLIAKATYSRTNRSGQYLFINNRPVSCPTLSYAIKDAYGTRLSSDQHPAFLLHLSIPPALIDINVHPQKKEVRLRDENLLKYALHGAINHTLGSGSPHFFMPEERLAFSPLPTKQEPALLLREIDPVDFTPRLPFSQPLHLIGLYRIYAIVSAESLPSCFFQEKKEGPVFFDLQAAEKRVQLETLLKNAEKQKPESQGLLFPSTFSCSMAEAALLHAQIPHLKLAGLWVEQAGKTSFLINAIPPFLEEASIQPLLTEILSSKNQETPLSFQKIALLLSLKAIRPKNSYLLEEARYLIENLLKTTDPHHCPQGKPTYIHIKDLGTSL